MLTWSRADVLLGHRIVAVAAALGLAVTLGALAAWQPSLTARVFLGGAAALLFVRFPYTLVLTWGALAMFGDVRLDALGGQSIFGALTYVSLPAFVLVAGPRIPRLIKQQPWLGVWIAFLVVVLVNLPRSPLPTFDAVRQFIGFPATVGVFAVFATEVRTPRRLAALTWAVLIPAAAIAALGCYQYFQGVGGLESQGVYRVFSVFEWTNTLAFFLIVPIGWAAFVIRDADSSRTRLVGWAVFGALVACEFFTFGRGGWIGALIAVAGPLVIAGPPPRIVARRALAFGGAALAGAAVLISWSALGLSDRVADVANIQGRAMIWDYVFRRAVDDPIIGHGFWSSNALTAQAIDELVSQGIHNSYLMVFFDYGLIGLVLFCGAWLLLLAQLARQIGRFDRTRMRLALAAGFTTLGVLIYSGAGIELVDFAPSMYLWMLLGCALQLAHDHKPAEVHQREDARRRAERQPALPLQHHPQ